MDIQTSVAIRIVCNGFEINRPRRNFVALVPLSELAAQTARQQAREYAQTMKALHPNDFLNSGSDNGLIIDTEKLHYDEQHESSHSYGGR
jgi:hypothetical protein